MGGNRTPKVEPGQLQDGETMYYGGQSNRLSAGGRKSKCIWGT